MFGVLRLPEGSVFAGEFEVRQLLAEGGMATVYAVLDRSCGELRALEVLLPELVADEKTRLRFAQEGRIGERFDSPYVPRIYRAGIDESAGMPSPERPPPTAAIAVPIRSFQEDEEDVGPDWTEARRRSAGSLAHRAGHGLNWATRRDDARERRGAEGHRRC